MIQKPGKKLVLEPYRQRAKQDSCLFNHNCSGESHPRMETPNQKLPDVPPPQQDGKECRYQQIRKNELTVPPPVLRVIDRQKAGRNPVPQPYRQHHPREDPGTRSTKPEQQSGKQQVEVLFYRQRPEMTRQEPSARHIPEMKEVVLVEEQRAKQCRWPLLRHAHPAE